MRDKSALLSQMASLSKHNRDLSRGKDILLAKAKVCLPLSLSSVEILNGDNILKRFLNEGKFCGFDQNIVSNIFCLST